MISPGTLQELWLWPFNAALRTGAAALLSYEEFLSGYPASPDPSEPTWTTPERAAAGRPLSWLLPSRCTGRCWPT